MEKSHLERHNYRLSIELGKEFSMSYNHQDTKLWRQLDRV